MHAQVNADWTQINTVWSTFLIKKSLIYGWSDGRTHLNKLKDKLSLLEHIIEHIGSKPLN